MIGGSSELATERFSMVTSDGGGAALGTISPTGGEHFAGPEVHPTQLQETWWFIHFKIYAWEKLPHIKG